MDLNSYLNEQKLEPGERVFEIDSHPEVMYILKEGRLLQETIIELEEYNKYPVVSQTNFRAAMLGKCW